MTTTAADPAFRLCRAHGFVYRAVPAARRGDFPTYEYVGTMEDAGIAWPDRGGFHVMNGTAPCCGGFLSRPQTGFVTVQRV